MAILIHKIRVDTLQNVYAEIYSTFTLNIHTDVYTMYTLNVYADCYNIEIGQPELSQDRTNPIPLII